MILGHIGAGGLAGMRAMQQATLMQQREAEQAAAEEQRRLDNEHRAELLRRAIAREGVEDARYTEGLKRQDQQTAANIALSTGQAPQDLSVLGSLASAIIGPDGQVVRTRAEREADTVKQARREIGERLGAGDRYGAEYLGTAHGLFNPFDETPGQRNAEWDRRAAVEHANRLAELRVQGANSLATATAPKPPDPNTPAPGSPEEYAHLLFATRRQMEQTAANQLSMAENAEARAAIHKELDDRADDFVSQRYGVPTQRELREKLTNFHSAALKGNQDGWQRIGAMYARAKANPVALHKFLIAARQYAPQWRPPSE